MELRHLRVLIAVADELHFGRAAERLHLTQPAVSGQIRQLENELGIRLFTRSARQVALTEAGQLFLADAHRIVRHADIATSSVRALRRGGGSRLRVGYVAGALPRALPVAVRTLAATADPPSIELTTVASRVLISQVRDESLDVAIVSLPAPVSGLHVSPFASEHAAVAVRAGRFDRGEREVPVELLAREVLLTAPRRVNPGFYDAVAAAFRTAGIPCPLVEVEGASVEELLLQVAAGTGMALVTESVLDRVRFPGVVLRRLSVSCELAAVTAEPPHGELVRRFLAALRGPALASAA
ncbi:MAG TPA: LysR family transcriptional regulator [Solirubrobacter sp.]